MATLLLTAVGAAVGGSLGGSVLGVAAGVIGKAVGGTVGALIDQKLLGGGQAPVETGKVTSFRVQNSVEGAPIPRLYGRMRVAGQLIWSTRFRETVRQSGGSGKGLGGGGPAVREYSYSVSIALALCEGRVSRIGRAWADGKPFEIEAANWRLHQGGEGQLPDALIEAIEGPGNAPAYRGTAYLVFEDLDVSQFGNRIPQFNFEVFRQPDVPLSLVPEATFRPAEQVRGIALAPGTGEYALSPDPVSYFVQKGVQQLANVNNVSGETDLVVSLAQLDAELPACDAVSLIVSWFGTDLRCGSCRIEPRVDQKDRDSATMPWQVSGVTRQTAALVSQTAGRPTYGGTPSDQSVVRAIRRMKADGRRVMFYPFVLMDIPPGNGLPDPWGAGPEQPVFPWRGRITLSTAPGRPGTPDKTAAAAAEVAAFFGQAEAVQFVAGTETATYVGPPDAGFRRFVLHYAHLCALAGGVDAFCIGSELRGLTQIRDGAASYPAVAELRRLAADVRQILGPATKIGYAADWSEYFGHQPGDGTGDVFFHLDPLWADQAIDFVGIDNYMPLSDWRDEAGHLDAPAGSIYSIDYLGGNVAGGEGYDWYYADQSARDAQTRSPIVDSAYGEHWVFRYKDLLTWWSSPHRNRPGGVRSATPTPWVPRSKPIWFTEFGCPAIDKGTNQPNVFFDPKSSESAAPHYSTGRRDDFIQRRYLQAQFAHWTDPANNPVSPIYGGPMVDLANAYVWAWDARPWPDFPARTEVWSDGPNYELGHWVQGRIGGASLPEVVADICLHAGVDELDCASLFGVVNGYSIDAPQTARQSLQPLMLAYGFDAFETDGAVRFRMRTGPEDQAIDEEDFALDDEGAEGNGLSFRRAPGIEVPDGVRLSYLDSENDYQLAAAEALHPAGQPFRVEQGQLPLALAAGQAREIADRWLAEMRIGRDEVRLVLPPSLLKLVAGDLVRLPQARTHALYRIERIEERGVRLVEGRRVETGVYGAGSGPRRRRASPAVPVAAAGYVVQFLDLPLLRGDETPHAPWIAVTAQPWPGPAAVFSAAQDSGYALETTVRSPSVMGETLDDLPPGRPWLFTRGPGIRVRVSGGVLTSRSEAEILNGANAAALRAAGRADWEVLQFRRAELIGPSIYQLTGLLRGQAGTEHLAADPVPAGAEFVLLDRGPVQLDLALWERGLPRHYRIGPASRPYTDASYSLRVESFDGAGLRPYAPVRLRAVRAADGAIDISWFRRARWGGDSWAGLDVPLAEDLEAYRVEVRRAGLLVRSFETSVPSARYLVAEQAVDLVVPPFEIDVMQISAVYGAGPSTRIVFND
jgi:hypothetical protein